MSVWIDIKYINLVGFRLSNFKWIRPNKLANCSCPICGDSHTDKHKARGYFMVDTTRTVYHCHNCNVSTTISGFLKTQFPLEYDEYSMEKFVESGGSFKTESVVDDVVDLVNDSPKFREKSFLEKHTVRLFDLDKEHPARKYIEGRGLTYPDLWYTENFKKLTIEFEPSYASSEMVDEPRIVIPFRDRDKNLTGFQGRAIGYSKMRYVTIKKDGADIVFGLDNVDFSKNVLVFEGALDSTLMPNALAANGSSLQRFGHIFSQSELSKMIYVYDNEPRNPAIVKAMKAMLDSGNRVVVWDKETPKDINLMMESGMTRNDILKLIVTGVSSGLGGILRLNRWKRC